MVVSLEKWIQVKEFNQRLRGAGIYAVINKVTGCFYIGSTTNLYKRRSHYSSAFNGSLGIGVKPLLRREFKKYGREAFMFRVLECVPKSEVEDKKYLEALENCWILASGNLLYNSRVWGVRIFKP
jgi:group I intron endonuclease